MVVCTSASTLNLKKKLSDQWEYRMEMDVLRLGMAMLIRSRQQVQSPLGDLPSHHCAALSQFADRTRLTAICVILQGPLVGCRIIWSFVHDSWPKLLCIEIADSCPDALVLLTMGKECPQLAIIGL